MSVRSGGVLWLVGTAGPVSALLFIAPTHRVGSAGWAITAAVSALTAVVGLYLVARPASVGPRQLLMVGYLGVTITRRVVEAVSRLTLLPSGEAVTLRAGVATLRAGEPGPSIVQRADLRLMTAKGRIVLLAAEQHGAAVAEWTQGATGY